MGAIRVISDPHFYHEKVAKIRGFDSLEHMHEHIILNWNKNVFKKDTVWILGDITLEKSKYAILDELKGIKKVVLGNHDQPQHVPDLLKYVNKVCGAMKLRGCWLTHMPIHPNEFRGQYFNIHGHVHNKTIQDHRYINVSAENLNYIPRPVDELIDLARRNMNDGNGFVGFNKNLL